MNTKTQICFLLMLVSQIITARAHVLVFVHLGPTLPTYIEDALWQACLFNSPNDVYVIANTQALTHANNLAHYAHIIPAETLKQSSRHILFTKNSTLEKRFHDPFWLYASERFLYLDDFMQQYDIADLFHIENDNMLYVDLKEILPIFHQHYKEIAAVFDNDERCIPGFFYVAHKEAMANLAAFFATWAFVGAHDMEILTFYKKQNPTLIYALPIIPSSYSKTYPLVSTIGITTNNPSIYSQHSEQFMSIFDAAAIGQYLGGTDPRNGKTGAGFINESCLFNPSRCIYEFRTDASGRSVPHMVFQEHAYRINNLHVHSKNLTPFLSKPRAS